MWVRGLKHSVGDGIQWQEGVAPHVGAWIETAQVSGTSYKVWSHPMWVRGLKHIGYSFDGLQDVVAPHVGAWIET